MPAPSKTQYARKAAGEDDMVCAYKGLRTTDLDKLHASGFDTTSYTEAREKYRQVAHDTKASATARQRTKHLFVAEKRKVLRALAGSKAKDVVPKPQAPRHIKDCAAKSSCGSKQRRRPGKNKKSEQVPVVNFGRAGDGDHQAGEQAFVCVAFANNEEGERAQDGEPVVAAEQPPDIAVQKSAQNEGVQCAEDGKPVVEEPERASVGSADALPAEASVWPAFANMEGAECAVTSQPVISAEQLSDIALEKSAGTRGVECSGDGQLLIEEIELTVAVPEDSLSAEVKSAAAKPLAILSFRTILLGLLSVHLFPGVSA